MGGYDLTLEEVDVASRLVHDVVDETANIIIGAGIDSSLDGKILITLIATGGVKEENTASFESNIDDRIGKLKGTRVAQDDNVYVPLGEVAKNSARENYANNPNTRENIQNDNAQIPAFIRKLKSNRGN